MLDPEFPIHNFFWLTGAFVSPLRKIILVFMGGAREKQGRGSCSRPLPCLCPCPSSTALSEKNLMVIKCLLDTLSRDVKFSRPTWSRDQM